MGFSRVCPICRTETQLGENLANKCCSKHSLVVHTSSIRREDGIIVDMQPVSQEEMKAYERTPQ